MHYVLAVQCKEGCVFKDVIVVSRSFIKGVHLTSVLHSVESYTFHYEFMTQYHNRWRTSTGCRHIETHPQQCSTVKNFKIRLSAVTTCIVIINKCFSDRGMFLPIWLLERPNTIHSCLIKRRGYLHDLGKRWATQHMCIQCTCSKHWIKWLLRT